MSPTAEHSYRRPRLAPDPGIRLLDAPDCEHVGARSVHYSDGWTEQYLGAVYREGRAAWSAYYSAGPDDLCDERVFPATGFAQTFTTRDDAVAAVLRAAEVHIPATATSRTEAQSSAGGGA